MSIINTAGDHKVTAIKAEVGESSKGTPQVQILFRNEAGEGITGWFFLSEKAFERTVKSLREAFGFDGAFETLPEQVEGKECEIVLGYEVGQDGKDRLRVKFLNAVGGKVPEQKPLSGGTSFLRQLSAKAKAVAGSMPPPRPAPKATPPKSDNPF